jgi:nitrate reductase (cytochrome), electron transfer subunit
MRSEDRSGVRERRQALCGALLAGALVFAGGALYAQTAPQTPQVVPRLTGTQMPMDDHGADPFARPIVDDKRVMRNYPEQPPVIPHAIENYQLTLRTNRCLECHRRQYTEASGAPMISVTHFMDRDGQVLADVTPRRYFCTACHVPQADTRPLVPNTFQDMTALPPTRR